MLLTSQISARPPCKCKAHSPSTRCNRPNLKVLTIIHQRTREGRLLPCHIISGILHLHPVCVTPGMIFYKYIKRHLAAAAGCLFRLRCKLHHWRTHTKRISYKLPPARSITRSEEHTSELQSRLHLVCRL